MPLRCEAILNDLAQGRLDIDASLRDTRALHKRLFENLTPEAQPYLAGHYRGEKFKCLRHLEVQVVGDRRVGAAPDRVAAEMANFNSHLLGEGLKALAIAFAKPDDEVSRAEKLNYLVKFSARLLVQFLRIHPYANGNGHLGRLMVWLLLAKFGYWPREWPLDEHPPYDELLSQYRDGEEQPLEDFILKAINGTATEPPAVAPRDITSASNIADIKTI